ncbi:hypothetical protein F3A66_02665 [Salmonella enterica subsp. enterica serovar Typhi]|nr:hypothetical protein [Salmonella enterica subsp. enterica serovar Typhi]
MSNRLASDLSRRSSIKRWPTIPLPIIASLTLLIFASISFLIKFTFIYLLMGIWLICLGFYKWRNCQAFQVCTNNIQNEGFLDQQAYLVRGG